MSESRMVWVEKKQVKFKRISHSFNSSYSYSLSSLNVLNLPVPLLFAVFIFFYQTVKARLKNE